jgi:hypothetical protein
VTDCEVCLEPDCANATITVEVPQAEPCPIHVCSDCIALMFVAMIGRYNRAVDENNEAVAQLFRLFGAEVRS